MKLISYTAQKDFVLKFPYDEDIVSILKKMDYTRYDSNTNLWYIDKIAKTQAIQFAYNKNFTLHKDILADIFSQREMYKMSISDTYTGNLDFSRFKRIPREYQKVCVEYALKTERVLICDDMGLGKTFSSIMTIELAEALPCVVVCPPLVLYSWEDEWNKTIDGRDICILKDKNSFRENADVYIVSYDSLGRYFDSKKGKKRVTIEGQFPAPVKSVIFDEFHKMKTPSSKRTKYAKHLAKDLKYRILLSGTPVVNRPSELIAPLQIASRLDEVFKNYKHFIYRYCAAKSHERFGLDISGASNTEELGYRLRNSCMIRRMKSEVLKELPGKQRKLVLVDLNNRKEYDKIDKEFAEYVKSLPLTDEEKMRKIRAEVVVKLGILRQTTGIGKIEHAVELIENIVENDEKVIVFAFHTKTIELLKEKVPNSYVITGKTSPKERKEIVDSFQEFPATKVLIGQIQAAGVGLTLTEANHVIFLELPWTPSEQDQGIDRAYRYGQQNFVTAYILAGRKTIDEKIHNLIERKRKLFNEITGTYEGTEVDIIKDILDLYSNEN